jgi:hypothetical protein
MVFSSEYSSHDNNRKLEIYRNFTIYSFIFIHICFGIRFISVKNFFINNDLILISSKYSFPENILCITLRYNKFIVI